MFVLQAIFVPMYRILRFLLFLFDAEKVHYFAMNSFRILCSSAWMRTLLGKLFAANTTSPVTVFGLAFRNAIGLGAGFDKNAFYLRELAVMGFGFVEIGTVTPVAQSGNEKPRLFRLPQDQALINRMGFNNDGVHAIRQRLLSWRNQSQSNAAFPLIIGGNIGKNKATPNEVAWKDYEICFNALYDVVDYFVVNVSSPNTPGLRALQEKDALEKILTHLQLLRNGKNTRKPILLKIAPDLNEHELLDVTSLAKAIQLDGLVVANTTIQRDGLSTDTATIEKIGAGGLSGKPLRKRSTEIIALINRETQGTIPVIASGGVFNGSDANEKLKAGASLVQVWTGFVYEGPTIVKKIMKEMI